jgi:hypothetical protein
MLAESEVFVETGATSLSARTYRKLQFLALCPLKKLPQREHSIKPVSLWKDLAGGIELTSQVYKPVSVWVEFLILKT